MRGLTHHVPSTFTDWLCLAFLVAIQDSGPLTKPRFTYKHLAQVALSSENCPLGVIAPVDLDAFYA